MARKKPATTNENGPEITDVRHKGVKRRNIPPAQIAAEGTVPLLGQVEYEYSPRRPPVLRFDVDGTADRVPALLAEARKRPLTEDEVRLLAEALRTQEPWLEWAGKRESQATGFLVDPVALHIHERVSAQAILRVAARQDAQRDLFSDPRQAYHEAVQFYRHDIDWTNRLILGDSLQVMASLARREDLAGKVQMIYMDPPYGIKFGSNFQPEVGKRDVKDKETDLTREPEMVKAYRDTWHLGVHSYLSYLRDRLVVARELLADTGSIFVQIGDENVHRVRVTLDEVFGPENCISIISTKKTSGATTELLPGTTDYLLWYARHRDHAKCRNLFRIRTIGGDGAEAYTSVLERDGRKRRITAEEEENPSILPPDAKVLRLQILTSQAQGRSKGEGAASWFAVPFQGVDYRPSMQARWKTNGEGMSRLLLSSRLDVAGSSLNYVRFHDDFPAYPLT